MEFLDDNKRIENLDTLRISYATKHWTPKKKKRGGVVGQITEVRELIVKMLNNNSFKVVHKPEGSVAKKYPPITIQQISMMTKGWTHKELHSIYREAMGFRKNPAALFWIKYKEFKQKNGEKIKARINERLLRIS